MDFKCLFFVYGKQEILMSGKSFCVRQTPGFLKREECTERRETHHRIREEDLKSISSRVLSSSSSLQKNEILARFSSFDPSGRNPG
ncbi:hypothetical protein CEXT_755421 [Caerostris extrusa]|uniref:Uncharacterized protein n=1 Tax=Caerostris extrusa TaxID=172846 RepID=A0AAV4MSX6_CAEEX|nr:hypothetical protein CEXT_755421 [Caerostris extrusa]